MIRRLPRRAPTAALGALLLTALTGLGACSKDVNSVAEQARAGDGKGYVAGDGTVEQLDRAKRGTPITLSGTTVEGGTWSMAADAAGQVVVVNAWGSWCPPCVQEQPQLQQVWADLQTARKPVAFIGIDILEGPETGAAFLRANHVTYPSLSNPASKGQPMLALQGKASATPTTLVLDTRGRIAARVLGATSAATLTAIVDDVLAEPA